MIPKNPSVWNAQNPSIAQMVTNQCVIRQQMNVFPVKMEKMTVSTANTSQAKQDVWSIKMIPKNPSAWNAQRESIATKKTMTLTTATLMRVFSVTPMASAVSISLNDKCHTIATLESS